MRKFLFKTGIITLFLVGLLSGLYITMDSMYNKSQSSDSLFIWGDSQSLLGIDLEQLKGGVTGEVYSAATHGAGVYDFLIFTDNVPPGSHVLLGLSVPLQIRPKEKDYNKSGLSLKALSIMYKSGYSLKEMTTILRANLNKPKSLFFTNTSSNLKKPNYKPKINDLERLRLFLNRGLPQVVQKQRVMIEGLNRLKEKGCKINLISFPLHSELKKVLSESSQGNILDSFIADVSSKLEKVTTKIIRLRSESKMMNDLTHLNIDGAEIVGRFIKDSYVSDSSIHYVVSVLTD